jgi:T5SS/PEP-CTERM-associated repeat protein
MNQTKRTHRFITVRGDVAPRLAAILLAILPVMAVCERTSAQTVWTAGADDWFTPANWTLGVPNAASGTAFDAIIANGGTTQISAPGGSVRRLRVGLVGGPGNLTVDGGTLNVTDDLHLNEGSAGPASMIVQGGSTVTAVDTVVGFNSAANTSFLIAGSGTAYNATTDFTVGRSGVGLASLSVEGGAVLASGTSTLGTFAGSKGMATVAGGARWSSTGAFTVGNAGMGTLNIEEQATVNVGTDLSIGNTSNVNLNGGTLRFATIGGTGGVSRLNYNSGTIQVPNAGFPSTTITGLFGASPTIPAGKTLVVETSGFFFSGASLGVTGGDLRLGSIPSFTGAALGVSSGNVSIQGDFTVNTGSLSASGQSST